MLALFCPLRINAYKNSFLIPRLHVKLSLQFHISKLNEWDIELLSDSDCLHTQVLPCKVVFA